jgi:hypothetical protein
VELFSALDLARVLAKGDCLKRPGRRSGAGHRVRTGATRVGLRALFCGARSYYHVASSPEHGLDRFPLDAPAAETDLVTAKPKRAADPSGVGPIGRTSR